MEQEVRRLAGLGQLVFRAAETAGNRRQREADLFLNAAPRELFVGAQPLDDYLYEVGPN
jgi:hypothetical protein